MVQATEVRQGSHGCGRRRLRFDYPLVRGVLFERVVNAVLMVQLGNTTPILGISVKSTIRGIHGMGGQYGYMPLS